MRADDQKVLPWRMHKEDLYIALWSLASLDRGKLARHAPASHSVRCMGAFSGVGLDQLRMLVTSVEEGSFSAAARRLNRTQPAVSEAIAQLEQQLGVTLFDRAGRYPRLTREGAALLPDARLALLAIDGLKARARGLSSGVEIELSAAIDFFVPPGVLTAAARAFMSAFPSMPMRLFNEALGAVAAPVLEGRAQFGVLGSLPVVPTDVLQERIGEIPFVWVAKKGHALGRPGRLSREEVEAHTQIVLADRSDLSVGAEYGVLSRLKWTVSDPQAKLAFLLDGVGWGGLPLHMVDEHMRSGRLVELAIDRWTPERLMLPLTAIYRADDPPGPASRCFIDFIKGRLASPGVAQEGAGGHIQA